MEEGNRDKMDKEERKEDLKRNNFSLNLIGNFPLVVTDYNIILRKN
jgi:hypothetical protein